MPQSTLTIVTKIRTSGGGDNVAELRRVLSEFGAQPKGERARANGPALRFSAVKAVHYARLFVVDEDETRRFFGQPQRLPAELVFSLVFDGGATECVDALIAALRTELDIVYALCDGYPGTSAAASEIREYLLGNDVPPFVFYQGAEGVSVEAVVRTSNLRRRLGDKLDALLRGGTAETPAALGHQLRERPSRVDPKSIPPMRHGLSHRERRLRDWAWFAVIASPFLLIASSTAAVGALCGVRGWMLWPLGALPLALLALALLAHEWADARALERDSRVPAKAAFAEVRGEEDHAVQNALTHCALVKAGPLRRFFLHFVFFAIRQRVRLVDRFEGSLGGIASIHFARWVPLDGGERLLFLSDYDGSWESYLGEFVDRQSTGLSAVWSNTCGFPKTWFLVKEGAKDEDRFKTWTRKRQLPTPIWYSAYPHATLSNIHDDVRMAQLLANETLPHHDPAWLELI